MAPRFRLTDEIRRALLAGFAAGGTITCLAPLCGCSRESLSRAIAADPAFAAEVAQAKAKGEVARRAAKASGAPAPSPPVLSLVPPLPRSPFCTTVVQTPSKPAPVDRDTRPIVRPGQVVSAITAAAECMRPLLSPGNMGPSVPPRWGSHEAWGSLRASFHCLPDGVRRELIARLLCEETARIQHDASASMNGRGG